MNVKKTGVMIDGREYDVDLLSDNAKQQITNLRVTDQEIRRLKQQLGIANTARAAYAAALTTELAHMDTSKH